MLKIQIMKKIVLAGCFLFILNIVSAQVQTPDSVDKNNNSANAREKGLHTNGATNEVKDGNQNTNGNQGVSGAAKKNNNKKPVNKDSSKNKSEMAVDSSATRQRK